jgi:hypothetical protein
MQQLLRGCLSLLLCLDQRFFALLLGYFRALAS